MDEIQVNFQLLPPIPGVDESPIIYKCAECGESVRGYDCAQHAQAVHKTQHYEQLNHIEE